MSGPVLIAGGDDRGAVASGLAVADELIGQGTAVHWLSGQADADRSTIAQRGIDLSPIGPRPSHTADAGGWRSAISLPAAIASALATILKVQPAAVLGIGGLPSSAGVIAAGMLGLPIVLHEPNATPSTANTTFAPWADLVCCGFEETVAKFASLPTEWTGNPVDARFFASPPIAPHVPPNLVVLGRGSLLLNRTLPAAVALLFELGITVGIRHHASTRWAEVVRSAYRDQGIQADIDVSLATPWHALQDADLVVARADAVTISEIAAAGRGAVLIPLKAPRSPQPHNAAAIARAGGAVVIHEDRMFAETVAHQLAELLRTPQQLTTMGECCHRMARPHAARRIARRLQQAGVQP